MAQDTYLTIDRWGSPAPGGDGAEEEEGKRGQAFRDRGRQRLAVQCVHPRRKGDARHQPNPLGSNKISGPQRAVVAVVALVAGHLEKRLLRGAAQDRVPRRRREERGTAVDLRRDNHGRPRSLKEVTVRTDEDDVASAVAFGVGAAPHFLPALFVHVAAAAPNVTWLEDFPLLEPLFDIAVKIDNQRRMAEYSAAALREVAEGVEQGDTETDAQQLADALDRYEGALLMVSNLRNKKFGALRYRWAGSATFGRLDAFRAFVRGMELQRSGQAEQALPHYESAYRSDSTFTWALIQLAEPADDHVWRSTVVPTQGLRHHACRKLFHNQCQSSHMRVGRRKSHVSSHLENSLAR